MKDRALAMVEPQRPELENLNRLREYLQHVILRELFELDVLEKVIFHGGTALRLLHGLERFSEDLDFHTQAPTADFEMTGWLNAMTEQLGYQGYDVNCSAPSTGNVRSTFIKFEGLLYESGLSAHENEKLRVKLEIDTNPPAGFGVDTGMVDHFFPYVVHHHDRPSFVAGKLHAIFQREWTKGRDYYDLMFYLSRWQDLEPNLTYLNNALIQAGYEGVGLTSSNWREETVKQVEVVNWDEICADLEPFVIRRADLKAFRREFLIAALREGK